MALAPGQQANGYVARGRASSPATMAPSHSCEADDQHPTAGRLRFCVFLLAQEGGPVTSAQRPEAAATRRWRHEVGTPPTLEVAVSDRTRICWSHFLTGRAASGGGGEISHSSPCPTRRSIPRDTRSFLTRPSGSLTSKWPEYRLRRPSGISSHRIQHYPMDVADAAMGCWSTRRPRAAGRQPLRRDARQQRHPLHLL